ncbi:extracellular solute-binding protein [Neobacillus niacini]|jgi:putative aldouronate transport system substrate-binding protein|uniref:extracellular solute-binding protein n=1 Tax=Neobacillus niacini TaxID=86668 RepID=UPI001C8EB745|nr:extracellular solute-binding protein [Neobacillus niacini]MBY0144417.1 extracellular solute-binding protein [Neobacillus niacini]
MKKRMKKRLFGKKVAIPAISAALLFSLAACSDSETSSSKSKDGKDSKNEIRIMTTAYTPDPPSDDSPVLKELEKFTNTNITMNWVLDSAYQDKLNITLASGDLPDVMMIPSKIPSFVSAVRDGAFWDLGPYLKDYPNLSKANEITLQNSAIDGKTYGIYRARPLGRLGVTFRSDWLNNVGLETPKTIDDFYNVLKAFTHDDPDGNGKDDTYGMVVSKYNGPWDIMQIWFGAPNKWGEKNGKLEPDFMSDEYMNALKFFKKLYDEKLINEDFAVMDPQKWGDPLMNSQAGVIVDVLDRGRRADEDFKKSNPELTEPIDILGAVEGPKGLRSLPTAGYSGLLAIPKSSVKTEEELKQVLTFLDKVNEEESQKLAYNGIEGRHYEVQDGKLVLLTNNDQALINEFTDLNQFHMGIPEDRFIKPEMTPVREKEQVILKENEKIVVPNPAESFLSEVYAQKGQQLDNIINDARTKFIVGQIDEAGFKDAIKLWRSTGGDDYIKEINDLYKKNKK